MKTGTILLIPFPFSELTDIKVRPAVVIAFTKDKYGDIILAAISSQVPTKTTANEILIQPEKRNGLRIVSVIKVDRIFTLKKEKVIAVLGELSVPETEQFITIFKSLPN